MQYLLNKIILDLLLPNQCIICQRLNDCNICSNCLASIPNTPNLWLKEQAYSQSIFHPKLNTRIQTPILKDSYLDSILTCVDFKNNIIKKSIHYLKYKNLPQLSQPLGSIMLRTLSQNLRIKDNVILCPIPLHPVRLNLRGYNQALLLAQYLEDKLRLPIYKGLHRVRNTPNQMKLSDKHARIINMHNAFKSTQKASPTLTNIILIDDVTTTLSTIQQAAKALKTQGFTSIHALVLAH
ncbi:MAG: ComF family protein [Minisyncoccia bacterium]